MGEKQSKVKIGVLGAGAISGIYFQNLTELFREVNPIPVKAALNMMGMGAGPLRLPLTEMEGANQAKLKKAMEEYGLL